MKNFTGILLLTPLLWGCQPKAQNDGILQVIPPEQVGMSAEKLSYIDSLVERYSTEGKFPGGVFLVSRKGKLVYYKNLGNKTLEADKPYQKGDIFRIASMTKAITTVAIMQLYERGMLGLDDPISKYLPAFENPEVLEHFNEKDSSYTTVPAKNIITIRRLLTHTSGIGSIRSKTRNLSAIYGKHYANISSMSAEPPLWNTEQLVDNLAKLPLAFEPGEQYLYGYSMDVLGRIIEVVSVKPLDVYLKENIFDPLGMVDTHFYPPKEKWDRLVPIHDYKDGKMVMREGMDPLAAIMADPNYKIPTYHRGGGGLTSTTIDYARFLQALLKASHGVENGYGNAAEDYRILGRKTIELMTSDQFEKLNEKGKGRNNNIGLSHCLGFALTTATAMDSRSPGTYEWGGSVSTKFIVDPKEELVFVGMSQAVPVYHQEFYGKMISIIYGAIVE